MSDTERELGFKAHMSLVEDLSESGELIVSEALADQAQARRSWSATARSTTDGPSPRSRIRRRIYLIECDTIEQAVGHRRPDPRGQLRPGRGPSGARCRGPDM